MSLLFMYYMKEDTMLNERLEGLYQKVMDLEKYSEAKNSILLTFIGAILLLLYSILGTDFYCSLNILFGSSIAISLLLNITSFLPYKDKKPDADKGKIPFQLGMSIFNIKHLDLVRYDDTSILSLLNQDSSVVFDNYQKQLLKGILYNARITKRKLVYFEWSISVLFVIPLILKYIKRISIGISKKITIKKIRGD